MATVTVNNGGMKPYSGPLVPTATTATSTTDLLLSPGCEVRGLILVVGIASGAGSVTVVISGLTSSGFTYSILTSAALSGAGNTPLYLNPSAPAVIANTTAIAMVPSQLQIVATVSGTTSYGIDYVVT